jgi:hypothetical protein
MLKSLVSSRANTNEHIEAVTAERDFFREKYAAQMNEMEALKGQLKESQRVIDRLRKQVLDLEMGRVTCEDAASVVGSAKKNMLTGGSSNTSLTSMNNKEEESGCSLVESLQVDTLNYNTIESVDAVTKEQSTNDDEAQPNDLQDLEQDASSDKDEADRIRANAERLLQWSDYQSRRSTLSPTNTPSSRKGDQGTSFTYDASDSNKNNVEREQEDSFPVSSSSSERPNSRGGKVSKFLNNLKDIIDPPFDDETDSDDERDESSDEESSIDHRSFDD